MNIFHTSSLPNGLRQETLSRLVRTLLLRLVDDNLGKQPEGEALLKVCALQMACWMVCAPSAHAGRIASGRNGRFFAKTSPAGGRHVWQHQQQGKAPGP